MRSVIFIFCLGLWSISIPVLADNLQNQIRDHKAKAAELTEQAVRVQKETEEIRQTIIQLAQDITAIDKTRDTLEARLATLTASEKTLTQQLQDERQHLARTLAGLQKLQKNPPPVFLIEPDNALAAIRGALLMAQIIPFTQRRAQMIKARLIERAAIRTRIKEQTNALEKAEAAAQAKHKTLASALATKTRAEQALREAAAAETDEVARLVKKARNLRDLTQRLKQRLQNKSLQNKQAKPPAIIADSAFSKARGQIPLPVAGQIDGRFGAPDTTGSPRVGLAIAARAGAQITAPYDGAVLYAGVFRHYGHIVILRIDRHYQVILAGLEDTAHYVGQQVLAGEPLGRIPDKEAHENNTRQHLYMELRYEGEPIDPTPWLRKG